MNKKDFPKVVKIVGKDYSTRLVKQPLFVKGSDNQKKEKLQAYIDYEKGTITIKNWSKGWVVESLIHETLHAISTSYDAGLTEEQVIKLSPGIHAFFRENRKILKLL